MGYNNTFNPSNNFVQPNQIELDNSAYLGVGEAGSDAQALLPDPLGILGGQGQKIVVDTHTDPLNITGESVQYFHGSARDVNADRLKAKTLNAFSLTYRHTSDVEQNRANNLQAIK